MVIFAWIWPVKFRQQGVTAIYGRSGSGKSTLLDCVAGLRHPDTGEISFGKDHWFAAGQAMPPWERRIGYVFQDTRLFPHLTVEGNLDYASKRATKAGPYAQGHAGFNTGAHPFVVANT
jgi:molybdate transport system ATP-binding protein